MPLRRPDLSASSSQGRPAGSLHHRDGEGTGERPDDVRGRRESRLGGDPVTGQGRGLGGGDAHGTDDQVRQDRGPAPGQEVRWPGCQALGFAGARLSGRGDLG